MCCLQCNTYAHRKVCPLEHSNSARCPHCCNALQCNGIKTDEQATGYLCKSCVRYMSKQVETSTGVYTAIDLCCRMCSQRVLLAGICMDVLGPFYPEVRPHLCALRMCKQPNHRWCRGARTS